MRTICCLILFTVATVSATQKVPDKVRLQGTWKAVVWEYPEGPLDQKLVKLVNLRWTFKGDRIEKTGDFQGFGEPGSQNDVVTFTLDESARPKVFDHRWSRRVPGNQTQLYKGIYDFKGDRLRVCYGTDVRPADFDASKGVDFVLLEFERVKQSGPSKPK